MEPGAPLPVIDGQLDALAWERAWGASRLLYSPTWGFAPAPIRIMNSGADLYVFVEDLPIGAGDQDRALILAFDTAQNGGRIAQEDDLAFLITEKGVAFAGRGNGVSGFTIDPEIGFWAAAVGAAGEFRWNAEFRIPLSLLLPEDAFSTSRLHMIGFQVSHTNLHFFGEDYTWPARTSAFNPNTYGELLLIRPKIQGDKEVLLDLARITQGADYDLFNRRSYDFLARRPTLVQASLFAPEFYQASKARVEVRRVLPPSSEVRFVEGPPGVIRTDPRRTLDLFSILEILLPADFFPVPGRYRFDLVLTPAPGYPQVEPIHLGTRTYLPANNLGVLLQPGLLMPDAADFREWGLDLVVAIPEAMRWASRRMPVPERSTLFQTDPELGQRDAGFLYAFLPVVLRPNPFGDAGVEGTRQRRLSTDALHQFNADLERRDPGNTLGRLDRAALLSASTGTGGGQAQYRWSPCHSALGFDTNPNGVSPTVLIHELLHCFGWDHAINRDHIVQSSYRFLDLFGPSVRRIGPPETNPRTMMFWAVTDIARHYPAAPVWNDVRQQLVDKPRLPKCSSCPASREGDGARGGETGQLLRVLGSITDDGVVAVDYTEVRTLADGFEPTESDPNGLYAIELLNEDGATLCAFSFSVLFVQSDPDNLVCQTCKAAHGPGQPHGAGRSGAEPPPATVDVVGFLHQVPLCDGAVRVAITRQGVIEWQQELPASIPVVQDVSAKFLEAEVLEVSWTAFDAMVPVQDLRHSVYFRRDADSLPLLLASGLEEPYFKFGLDFLPEAEGAAFIARTTNGRNSDEAESNPLEIAARPPGIMIVRPGPDDLADLRTSVIQGQPYLFTASAWDNLDGPLDGEAIKWFSDAEGFLGYGASVELVLDVPGGTVVTAIAEASSGLVAQAATQLFVFADSDGDGLPDVYEDQYPCLDPFVADSHLDPDGDELSSLLEFQLGTNPCNPDTSNNGVSDFEILLLGGDPTDGQTPVPEPSLFAGPGLHAVAAKADETEPILRKVVISMVGAQPIGWSALASEPWIELHQEQGFGDGLLFFSIHPEDLAPGMNHGVVFIIPDDGSPVRLLIVEADREQASEAWLLR